MGTPGCRLGAGAGGRPPETREHQSEAGDDPSRAWRRLSQKQERTPSHPRAWRRLSQKQETTLPEPGDASVRSRRGPFQSLETPQSEAGEDPLPSQSLETPQSETGKDPTPRAWRRLSQKQERTLPEPGDASVRSTTPHHPEPRGASVRSRGGDPQVCPSPHVPAAAADTDIFWFASTNKNHNISQLFKATQHRKILAKKPK